MKDVQTFELTEQHVKLLRSTYVNYDDWTEFGAPTIDPKRPYGNGDVYDDMREILGRQGTAMKDNELLELHKETAEALQVILSAGSFEPGVYETEKYRNKWARVEK